MVYSETDGFNNAERYDVLLNAEDAKDLSISERELVVVYNQHGVFTGKAKFVDIARGNLEVHFPEGNFLLPKGVYEGIMGVFNGLGLYLISDVTLGCKNDDEGASVRPKWKLVSN